MNLHEFCEDSQVLEYFKRLQEGDLKVKEFLAEKMGDLSIEYFEIGKGLSQNKIPFHKEKWEQMKEDIQQELVCKLLICKFSFLSNKGKLKTYIVTMIVHMIIDEHRKSRNKDVSILPEESQERETISTIKEDALSWIFHKKYEKNKEKLRESIPVLLLKKEYTVIVQSQTCLRRTILKLWRPYFFSYKFEPDEIALLESKKNNLVELKIQMQQEIMEELERSHKDIFISPDKISQWLQMSRNAIERHLCVLRKNIPCFQKENLRYALAEKDF